MGRRPRTIRDANAVKHAWLSGLLPGMLRWGFACVAILLLFGAAARAQSTQMQIIAGLASPGSSQDTYGTWNPGTCPGPNPGQPCIIGGSSGNETVGPGNCNGGLPGPPSDQPTSPVPLCNFGYSGDGGAATYATMSFPIAVAADANGNVYIADAGNAVVREVDTSGNISTYACVDTSGNISYGSSCPVSNPGSFPLVYPAALVVDSNGVLHIATAGNGANFGSPLVNTLAMAADSQGNVYKLQEYEGGTPPGDACSVASYVITGAPNIICMGFDVTAQGLAVDSSGNLYTIVNTHGGELWEYASGSTSPTTIATSATIPGLGLAADVGAVNSLAVDSQGNIYVLTVGTSSNGFAEVEKFNPTTQQLTVIAGVGTNGYNNPDDANGPADLGNYTPAVDVPLPAAQTYLNNVNGIALGPDGSLYIADSGNNMVRKIQVLASGPSALNLVDIPVPQSSGVQFGSKQAVYNPGTGDFYYVSGANTVNVINTGSSDICPGCERIFASIPVGLNNGGSTSTLTMALDPTRNLVYVNNTADGNLYVINGNPGQATSYTSVGAANLGYGGLSLVAIDPGLNEVYVAGPNSTTIVALSGGVAPQVLSAYTSLYTPIASMSVDTATHTVYAVGAIDEGYPPYQEMYLITPGSSGLTVETDSFPTGGSGLGSGLFDTNSISVDPVTASVIAAGSGQYNGTDWYAWDISNFGVLGNGTYVASPLLYTWQPYTSSLDIANRAFYLTDFDGSINDTNSNAAMVTGMDSVTASDNTLTSVVIPVFGSGSTPSSPHVYDVEPDTSSYQAWISGSDATDGGFIKLWNATTQAVTLSATIPALLGGGPLVAGGNLFVDSADQAAYLLDHVNNDLWLVNKPQWTQTGQPFLAQQGSTVSITGSSNPIYYTTDGTPPGLSSTTQSCTSPCTVNLVPGVPPAIVSAIQEDLSSGVASNVVQGVFTAISPTTLALSISPSPATTGASITATATLSLSFPALTVIGTVNFTADGTTIPDCSGVSLGLNGSSWQATCTFTENTAGTYAIAAAFSGDASNGASNSNVVDLQVNQSTAPTASTVTGVTTPLAINANNSGTNLNAVLNADSSVSLVQNGALVSGVICSAFSSLSGGSLSSGAIYLDGANSRAYFTMIASVSGTTGLYAAYDTFNVSAGTCTQGPLVQLSTNANSDVEMNADIAQGNVYVLNYYGAFPDSLYVLPAPWSSSLLTPAQFTMDYSVEYGPIVIDPSNHQVYINDLGGSANGAVPGTFSTSGFFVYDPTYTGSASNPEHVAGYMTSSTAAPIPFNVGTLLDNGNGTLVLVNENPNASSAAYSASTPPVTILNTATPGFSFFANTQPGSIINTVDITTGNALTTIAPATQYYAISGADINAGANLVYAFVFDQSTFAGPQELIAYNYAAPQETVLSSSVAMPSQVPDLWMQLNYDSESTQIALSASTYNSGALGVTTPLCAGSPSLTILFGGGTTPTPLDFPVVNADSGYIYAIQSASTYPPPGTPAALEYVAPPASPCTTSQPTPAAINAVSGGGQSATIGQAFANPLVVNVTDANGNPVSGATVTFTAPSSGASATLSSMTATTSSNGNASVTATANGTAGTSAYQVSASVAGVSTLATFSLTNTQAATTLGVTPSALSLVYGQMVAIQASISPASVDGSVPTGSVAFYDGTIALTPDSTVSGAIASYTVNVPTVGSHTYAAQYLGDTNFQASALTSATSAVTVSKASVTLTGPATQPVTVPSGQSGSIAITVSGEFSGSGISTPSGSVSYSVSGSGFPAGTATISGGTATIPVPATTAPSSYTVTVNYAGDANYAAATAINVSLTVTPSAVLVTDNETITVSDADEMVTGALSGDNEAISVVDTVSVQVSGYPIEAVNDNETITVSDADEVTPGALSANNEAISVADAVSVQVGNTPTITTLTSSVNPSPAGYNVTLTATIAPSPFGSSAGSIAFMDGTTLLATVPVTGNVAMYSTTSLPAGADQITAVYSGNTAYLASTSAVLDEQISGFKLDFTTPVSLNLLPGQSAAIALTVTPDNGSYNEPVTFTVSGLPTGATATFNPAAVTPGSSPATASVTIIAPPLSSQAGSEPALRRAGPIVLALLLPLAAFGRKRRLFLTIFITAFALAAAMGLGACGGAGFFNQAPETYTVTVTGSSGAVQHSATLTLTVE